MKLTKIAILVSAFLAPFADADEQYTHDNNKRSLLESCRSEGFDPWQLSCETCELLPNKPHQKCLECCQTYKTSDALTKPYESAVLVHRPSLQAESEMEQFLTEHFDDLVKLKGSKRLIKMEQDDSYASSSRFMFMRPPSQMMLWFDEVVAPGQTLKAYKDAAKEIVTLDGYKKDDMKDMLTTLLPDKK